MKVERPGCSVESSQLLGYQDTVLTEENRLALVLVPSDKIFNLGFVLKPQ